MASNRRPPPSAATSVLEPDVQAHLGSALLPLVELAARGELITVLARPAARGDRQRLDLDVEVAPVAQQVHLAVGHAAESPARPPPRGEVVHPPAADAPLARHPSAPPGVAASHRSPRPLGLRHARTFAEQAGGSCCPCSPPRGGRSAETPYTPQPPGRLRDSRGPNRCPKRSQTHPDAVQAFPGTSGFSCSISAADSPACLLAMQKVEGSNPFSRSSKGFLLQVSFVGAVGWFVCVAPDRNRTRGRPTVHSTRRRRLFAGDSGTFERLSACEGDAEGHGFDPDGESVSVRARPLPLRGNGRATAANGEKVTVALDTEMVARKGGARGAHDTPDAAMITRR
jgi:hypothetical protein